MKTYQNKNSFTLIEFIFVILITSVIAGIFINKIINQNNNSKIISCKNDLSIIKLAIKNNIQNSILKNTQNDLINLEDDDILFSNILKNFNSSNWEKLSNNTYKYILNDGRFIKFIYSYEASTFTCNKTKELCKEVLN